MLTNFIHFQFSGIHSVHCLFHGKSNINSSTLGSITFNRGENNTLILQNRKFLYEKLAMPVCEISQIHSDKLVFDIDPIQYSEIANIEADGIATKKRKTALLIKTADCQPILITHKTGQHIMALHVGWRGNKINFIQKAIDEFCAMYQIMAKDLYAVRGPSLGPNESEFINFSSEWGNEYTTWYNEKEKTLNLWELTKFQLHKAGLLYQNIYGLDLCTKTLHHSYFSHRENNNTGRQASIIWFE